GSARSSQRGVMPCICGTDLVVVARVRAAATPNAVGGFWAVLVTRESFPARWHGWRRLRRADEYGRRPCRCPTVPTGGPRGRRDVAARHPGTAGAPGGTDWCR